MQSLSEHKSSEFKFKLCLAIFGVLFLFGVILSFISLLSFITMTPNVHRWFPKKEVGLPGSEARALYVKPPHPMEFRIYVFNVANKDDVIHGAKPKLEEVGPYVFEEWVEKFEMTDDDEDDSLTFNMKKTLIFRPDLSKGLTGNEPITIVHPIIMGMALAVNVNRKPMLPIVIEAIDAMFHHPTNPFWTGRVMDYLFDGIEIDCTSEVFAVRAVCSAFRSIKVMEPAGENFFKFSVLKATNGTGIGTYKVKRGIKSSRDVGGIVSFDNEIEMNVWGGDECNRYKGTDSTVFPPEIRLEDGLWSYEPEFCMSLGAQYDRESSYQDVPTFRFALDFGDATTNDDLECYCRNPPEDCPRRGTRDLFDCIEAPIVLSLPHFYNADASLLSQFQSGLNPNESKHAYFMDYDTVSGRVPYAAKRLQINLDVVPIGAIDSMKHLPEVLMPLMWIEEITTTAPVNGHAYINTSNYQHYHLMHQIIQWMAIITGAAGLIISMYMNFKIQKAATVVRINDTGKNAAITSNADVYKKC